MIAIFTFKLSDLIAGGYAGRKVNTTKPCFLTPRDAGIAALDVRFGSKADIEARPSDVRFTPNSGHR
jgi:hypothetical protein